MTLTKLRPVSAKAIEKTDTEYKRFQTTAAPQSSLNLHPPLLLRDIILTHKPSLSISLFPGNSLPLFPFWMAALCLWKAFCPRPFLMEPCPNTAQNARSTPWPSHHHDSSFLDQPPNPQTQNTNAHGTFSPGQTIC